MHARSELFSPKRDLTLVFTKLRGVRAGERAHCPRRAPPAGSMQLYGCTARMLPLAGKVLYQLCPGLLRVLKRFLAKAEV